MRDARASLSSSGGRDHPSRRAPAVAAREIALRSRPMRLGPGDVDVYIAMPERIEPALLAAYDALMTESERERQRKFVFERNRREHRVTRALVRTTLSRYRPIAPSAWCFARNAHGCP